MQEGMLFHSLSDSDSAPYFEQYTCIYKGKLSVESYKRAWQRVVDHHPVLRTLVVWERKGKPLQVVRKKVELEWQEEDWREIPKDQHSSKFDAFLLDCLQRGFNLKKAPLMNMALIRVADDEYFYVWNFHHLILDGWSSPLLFQQVFALYNAFSRDSDIELKHTPPYRNYIAWLQTQDMDRAQRYWEQALEGFTAPTPININGATAVTNKESSYKKLSVRMSENVTATLKSLARQHQITLNTITQGAWSFLLSKYSGEDDVVFGSIVSGRPAEMPGVEEMVGLFINTLPVRVRMSYESKVFDWLKQIQLQQIESRELEYSPLVDVQKWSEVPRGLPLFESIVVFENYPSVDDEGNKPAFTIENESTREQTGYPLTIGVETTGQILLNCILDLSRYDADAVGRMLTHLQNILENIASEPEQKVEAISLLSDAEKQQIAEWNKTEQEYPILCVHQLTALQSERIPDKVAVSFNEENITFAKLDQQANKLAHFLQQQGVQTGDLIGICMERSIAMIVAMLGIHKAGASYLPLDPDYPEQRIEFILADANVPLLLTDSALEEQLAGSNSKLVLLDQQWADIESFPDNPPDSSVTPDSIAYVIYTSGSTGKPKGVQVPHRAVANFLSSMARQPGISEDDVLLAVTTLSFDIAVLELFLPLTSGARIELADRFTAADGVALLERIKSTGVTVMQATPATWRLMLAAGWEKADRFKVLCGGEAMPADLAKELAAHSNSVWNMYGPTETTVWSTVYQIQDPQQPVLIGKPISNTKIHILDENMQHLPIGVAGEMYIGGEGVALGYLRRDELTEERFVKVGTNAEDSEKLYRTGDLVRYKPDGNIEYINRLDNQVKVRGFRIELGEIESILTDHLELHQAVVITREDSPGDTRLVAYYVSHQREEISVTSLRKHLRERLPNYMIPQHFVELESMPVTPNGKIDRLALPAPFHSGMIDGGHVEPATENEKMLAEIWKDILDLDNISINDNFFELGGHSLLSIQVIARLKEQTGVTIEFRPLLMATLGQIAARCLQPAPDAANDSELQPPRRTESLAGRFRKKIRSTLFSSR